MEDKNCLVKTFHYKLYALNKTKHELYLAIGYTEDEAYNDLSYLKQNSDSNNDLVEIYHKEIDSYDNYGNFVRTLMW